VKGRLTEDKKKLRDSSSIHLHHLPKSSVIILQSNRAMGFLFSCGISSPFLWQGLLFGFQFDGFAACPCVGDHRYAKRTVANGLLAGMSQHAPASVMMRFINR